MCGIGGFIHWTRKHKNTNQEMIEKLSKGISHRGPDYAAEWLDKDGKICLLHSRLSILDLDSRSNQPFNYKNDPNSHILTFNGEIYNYKEIRSYLISVGYKFITDSDTEVLYQAYNKWGIECLEKINGMYGFAIWDRKQNKLFAARDPYGIKPLYYTFDNDRFIFSSEVKPIYEINPGQFSNNDSAFLGLLLNGYIPEPLSTYSEINKLEAGCYIEICERHIKQIRYASITEALAEAQNANKCKDKDSNNNIRQKLKDSVSKHTQSDADMCIFLSSGIDSTLLLALANEELSKPIQTYTLAFEDSNRPDIDESYEASKIAKYYGSKNETIQIDKMHGTKYFEKYFCSQDQPCIDGFNTWILSKKVAEMGYKVALSGLGADELFSGYDYYQKIDIIMRMMNKLGRGKKRKKMMNILTNTISNKWSKIAAIPTAANSVSSLYGLFRQVISLEEIEKIMGGDFVESGLKALPPIDRLTKSHFSPICETNGHINAIDSTNYLAGQLLSVGDTASMSHSIELRTPYVDYKLLEDISSIVTSEEWKTKKKLNLLEVPDKKIPDFVYQKKKQGFSLPMDEWLEHNQQLNSMPTPTNWHWSKKVAVFLVNKYY